LGSDPHVVRGVDLEVDVEQNRDVVVTVTRDDAAVEDEEKDPDAKTN
jgi:hypothetical protein